MSVTLKPSANLDSLGEGTYRDCRVGGLQLRVGKHRATWSLRYRPDPKGQPIIVTLGHYPTLGWKAARAMADAVRDGELPAKAETVAVVAKPVEPTLGAFLNDYESYRLGAGHRVADFARSMVCVRKHLAAHLDRPATAFCRRDFLAIRDGIVMAGKTPTANHLQAYVGAFLKWATERDLMPVHFLAGIGKAAKANVDDRVLTPAEITAVWNATASDHAQLRAVRFILLTGCRRGEAAALRYRDVVDGMWELKEHKAKDAMGTAYHPLSAAALAVVGTGEPDALVFPGEGGEFSGWSKFMAAFRAKSQTADWSLKALRTTMATTMAAELGIPTEIIDRCQGHTVKGVAVHYVHTQRPNEQRAAFEAWAAHIVPKPLAIAC